MTSPEQGNCPGNKSRRIERPYTLIALENRSKPNEARLFIPLQERSQPFWSLSLLSQLSCESEMKKLVSRHTRPSRLDTRANKNKRENGFLIRWDFSHRNKAKMMGFTEHDCPENRAVSTSIKKYFCVKYKKENFQILTGKAKMFLWSEKLVLLMIFILILKPY